MFRLSPRKRPVRAEGQECSWVRAAARTRWGMVKSWCYFGLQGMGVREGTTADSQGKGRIVLLLCSYWTKGRCSGSEKGFRSRRIAEKPLLGEGDGFPWGQSALGALPYHRAFLRGFRLRSLVPKAVSLGGAVILAGCSARTPSTAVETTPEKEVSTPASGRAGEDSCPIPAQAGVVNVRDFGARGDGIHDDTEAIREAVRRGIESPGGRYAAPAFVYLPAGTYLVTGPIESRVATYGWSGGWRAGMILVGESRTGSVIRLADRCPGYGDPNAPRWVVATGSESDVHTKPGDPPRDGGGNRAFRHAVIRLTIDTGRGNPGAVALDFLANNRGTVEEVTLRSGDGSGFCGLRMERHWPGPALIHQVKIEGFDYGIRVGHFQYSLTLEHVTLIGQRVTGLLNHQNLLAIRGLLSSNAVPAIQTRTDRGLIVLLDSRLIGGRPGIAAVTGENKLFLRHVTVGGYGIALEDVPRRRNILAGPRDETEVAGYWSDAYTVGDAPAEPLSLPISECPRFWPRPEEWAWPTASPGEPDATEAIQLALDSGQPAVGLPNGVWRIHRPLLLRHPALRLVTGFQSELSGKGVSPAIRFESRGTVILEHLRISGSIEHAGPGTLVVRHCDFAGYVNTPAGTGDVFLADTIGKPIRVQYPQRLWGRQVNSEFGEDPLIENHGGTVWLLGYKTEGEMVCYRQTAGWGELLGTQFYPLNKKHPVGPAILVEGGACSAAVTMNDRGYQLYIGRELGNPALGIAARTVGWRSAALVRCGVGKDPGPLQ